MSLKIAVYEKQLKLLVEELSNSWVHDIFVCGPYSDSDTVQEWFGGLETMQRGSERT